ERRLTYSQNALETCGAETRVRWNPTPLMQLTSVLRSNMKWEHVGVGRILHKLDKGKSRLPQFVFDAPASCVFVGCHSTGRLPNASLVWHQNKVDEMPRRRVEVESGNSIVAFAKMQSRVSSSRHEPPTRPISRAKASGWVTGSTFCSREPDRRLGYIPSEGDS